jgi:general secretion pathway protein B
LPQPTTPEASNYHSLPTLQELPAALRQAIPPLTLGGYIYSSKQAERSILINKRLHQEGDAIAPNLRLESMTPEDLILNYQGKRFRQAYSSR